MVVFVPSARADANMDNYVKQMMQYTRENITKAKFADGTAVPAETPEELQHEIVPFPAANKAVSVGQVTGIAQWCALDWKKFYQAYIRYETNKKVWTPKQLAYLDLVENTVQDSTVKGYAGRSCSPEETIMIRDKIKEQKF